MTFPRFLAAASLLAVAACVPRPEPVPVPAPTPTPIPTPTPTPLATPVPVPFVGSWIDAPLTPGDWSYANGTATFGLPGNPRLTLTCAEPGRSVTITYLDVGGGLTIRTEAMARALETFVRGSPRAPSESAVPALSSASIPAYDPLLDAMAFSKGRFAVEAAGAPTLYIPSYPEVSRVIEDCR